MANTAAEAPSSPPNTGVSYGPHELEVRALNCETSTYNAWVAGHRHPLPDRDTLLAKVVEIGNACRAPLGLPPMVNRVPPEVKPLGGSSGQAAMENFARLVRSGSVEVIRTYLSAPGVDVNARAAAGGADKALLDYAAELDQMPIAQYLLEHGAQADSPQVTGSELGLTPLHRAARAGAADMMGLLLAHGAEINAHGPLGNTPLMYAASSGSRAAVELLLTHGADITTQNGHLQSAVSIAAATGYTDIVDLIAAHLPTPTEESLDQAAARADVPTMNLMLMHDALMHDISEAEKQSALRLAVITGTDDLLERKQVIDLLLAHGADLNEPGINSPYTRPIGLVETPAMLQFLITKGAALRMDGSDGSIAQALACGSQIKDPIGMFTVLLAQGVNIAAVPAKGEDALECAVRLHRLDFEAFLLNHGVPANLRDAYGHTAASVATDPATLQLLIDHGADPRSK
jgi:ankyrin repeat protein